MNHSVLRSATAAWLLTGIPAGFISFASIANAAMAPVAIQGDAKDLMQQGLDLLRRGEDAAALEKFRAAVASNPSNEDAIRIYKEVDEAVWLRMLAKGGDYEQIARALLAKATPVLGEYKKDSAVINPLVDQALGDDFAARQIAIAKLAGGHGPYAIQHLVGGFADAGNDTRRIRAMEAAFRIGSVGVPALLAVLESADATARRSATVVLGRLKDPRGLAPVAFVAETDGDSIVRAEARLAAESLGGAGYKATDLLTTTAIHYLRQNNDYVKLTETNSIVWDQVDGKIVDMATSRALFGVEMARRSAMKSLIANPENAHALGVLAMIQAEGRVLVKSMPDDKALADKIPAISEELRLCGSDALMHGLQLALELGDSRLACELIQEVAATATRGSADVANKLMAIAGKANSREVRLTAAAGATIIDGHSATRDDVAAALAEAVGERVQRVAVIIDENADRRGTLEAGFSGARWFAATADSGISGLARIRRFAGCDVILVSSSLKDVVAEQLINELKTDERTKNIPVLAIAPEKETDGTKARFGDKIKGVVAKFDAAAMDTAVGETPLNPERMRAEDLAAAAARGLAAADSIPPSAQNAVLTALADAAGGRADVVRVPAIDALGRFGGDAQQGALAGVLNDTNASTTAKSSAGLALAGLGSRGVVFAAETLKALEGALGHADAGVRAAAASALGRTANLDAAARLKMLQSKQMTLSTGGAAAPSGGGSN